MGLLDLLVALVCAVFIQHAQEKERPAGAARSRAPRRELGGARP